MRNLSFFDIYNTIYNNKYKIEMITIPRIQRDYVQGRIDDKVNIIRRELLYEIKRAFDTGIPANLNFIYGSIEEGEFIPLDGQQRLTTLFLLHWYASRKENIPEEGKVFLNDFRYLVRDSSQDFIEKLNSFSPSFTSSLSNEIRDQSWYPDRWEYDPTISSMLVMLEDIDFVFKGEEDIWIKLTQKHLVVFEFLPIEELGMTDDIYIKMNTRGKLLTPFEKLKARLEKSIQLLGKNVSDRVSRKIDGDWTDIFWSYHDDNNCSVDVAFKSYIESISQIIQYESKNSLPNNEKELCSLYSNRDKLAHFEALFDSSKTFKKDNLYFERYLSKTHEKSSKKVFMFDMDIDLFAYCTMSGKVSYNSLILLYAFLVRETSEKKISDEVFMDRFRIVRNLVLNSKDEMRPENMSNMIIFTKEIILNGIPSDITKAGFNGFQIRQEIEKENKYIGSKWEYDLKLLEDCSLIHGDISIVDINKPELFAPAARIFKYIKEADYENRWKFLHAFLCVGDYHLLMESKKRMYLASPSFEILDTFFHYSQRYEGFNERTMIVFEELLKKIGDNPIEESLDNIIKDWLPVSKDWRYYFLKYYENVVKESLYGIFLLQDSMYDTIVMSTKQNISVNAWNCILCALYACFTQDEQEKLGFICHKDYLEFVVDGEVYYLSSKGNCLTISHNKEKHETCIKQTNGIDDVDRVEYIESLIRKMIKN